MERAPMKIVIVTLGSLGDTAPYVGLGARLKAAGHDVAVAAQEPFGDLVRGAGLELRAMPGDIRADLASEYGQRLHRAGSWPRALPAMTRLASRMMEDLARGIVGAARGAEVLLVHRLAMLHGRLVARAMGVPALVLELFPSGIAPTREFLPAVFGARSLGGWGNRAVHRVLRWSGAAPSRLAASLRDFQREIGLAPETVTGLYRRMDAGRWPIYHGFSAAVVPRPPDWREGLEVVGYFWPWRSPEWRPPAELLDFLDAGPPPVFIGFGSLVLQQGERLAEIVSAAVREAGVRAVVQAGWGRLTADTGRGDVLCVGTVPHDWLFPRVAAVVHAASAGVTGAGLRAGVPAVPIPAMNDQPFWAGRLVRLGVSPGAIRFQRLSAARLASLVREAVSQPSFRRGAQALAARVRAEDGAGRVIEALRRTDLLARWKE
jgi:sterol 3beta-glucosyltransferase